MPRQSNVQIFSSACALLFMTSCASIINGKNQKVEIVSEPSGAAVTIDGTQSGATPTSAQLSRKGSHQVELSLAGYEPYQITLSPKTNGATMGNIVAGGLIGIAIDQSTGAGNTLHPKKVHVVLQKR